MRVLLAAQWYPPIIGGEEGHVQALGRALAARGHQVVVATLRQPNLPAEEMDSGVKVMRLQGTAQRLEWLFSETDRRSAQPFPDPEIVAGLRQIIEEFRPDVVHAHNWIVHSLLPIRHRFDGPLLLTLHDYSLVCAKKTLVRSDRLCSGPGIEKCLRCAGDHYGFAKGAVTAGGLWASARRARRQIDAFIPVSQSVARWNGLEGGDDHWEVIPNFVRDAEAADARFDHLTSELPDAPFVMFAGALSRAKGVDVLLEAHQRMERRIPLVLIGYPTSETPSIDGRPDVLAFREWPRGAVQAAWSRSAMGVVPSAWRDPCPTVAMEAMQAGRPVVASSIGGLPEIVVHEESGLLVEPGSVEQLARALDRIVMDPGLAGRLGAGAAERAQRFTASAVVPRIEEVYRQLRSDRGPASAASPDQ